MCSQEELQQITRLVTESYQHVFGSEIVDIYLYGSYARGDEQADSDIDMVAIVNGSRKELQEKIKQVWDDSADIGLKYDVVISPVVVPYLEYQQYKEKLPYYRNIDREGVKAK